MAKSRKLTGGLYFGQKFESEFIDIPLFNFVRLIQTCLIEIKHYQPSEIRFLELRVANTFFYEIINHKSKRKAYLGRDAKTGETAFLMHDEGRLLWAKAEGFYDNEWTAEKHAWVYKNIGVIRHLAGINDLISFLDGAKTYECKGDYIKD